jgi:hypothetical protein
MMMMVVMMVMMMMFIRIDEAHPQNKVRLLHARLRYQTNYKYC